MGGPHAEQVPLYCICMNGIGVCGVALSAAATGADRCEAVLMIMDLLGCMTWNGIWPRVHAEQRMHPQDMQELPDRPHYATKF